MRRKQETRRQGKGTNKQQAPTPRDLPAPGKVVLPGDKNPIKVRNVTACMYTNQYVGREAAMRVQRVSAGRPPYSCSLPHTLPPLLCTRVESMTRQQQARSLPVPLSDELSGSLRLVKAKGSLASEALEGLQRRGEYEPVGDKKRARPKQRVKYVEKFRGE